MKPTQLLWMACSGLISAADIHTFPMYYLLQWHKRESVIEESRTAHSLVKTSSLGKYTLRSTDTIKQLLFLACLISLVPKYYGGCYNYANSDPTLPFSGQSICSTDDTTVVMHYGSQYTCMSSSSLNTCIPSMYSNGVCFELLGIHQQCLIANNFFFFRV